MGSSAPVPIMFRRTVRRTILTMGSSANNPLKNQAADDPCLADDLLHNLTGRHVCAQCRLDPPEGKERLISIQGQQVWLHTECQRFYVRAFNAEGDRPW
jgi:hypothetical protein